MMNAALIADVAGCVAFATLVASPLMPDRRMVLVLQLAAGLSFASHYAALGVLAACAVNVVGSVQTVLAILAPSSRLIRRLGWALVPVLILTAALFWQGPVTILASLAMISIAIGRMQMNELHLRLLVLLGGAFWIGHDLLVQSWIALSADIVCAACGIFVLARRFLPERGVGAIPVEPA
jgi:hypothetical protein